MGDAELNAMIQGRELTREEMIAVIEERVAAHFATAKKVPYDREGLRDDLGPDAELVVEKVHEDGSVMCSVRLRAPVEAVVLSGAVGPQCHPMAPCGCHGCVVCNGAQAPIYGYGASTPALGVPVLEDCTFEPTAPIYACNRYNPCGHYDCQKCFPGQILPPDMRGSKKPNGGGSQATKAANAEKGYRVCSYATWLNTPARDQPGERFSTPDMATQRARKQAKAEKETFLVLRDGARWKLLKADGDEVVIG